MFLPEVPALFNSQDSSSQYSSFGSSATNQDSLPRRSHRAGAGASGAFAQRSERKTREQSHERSKDRKEQRSFGTFKGKGEHKARGGFAGRKRGERTGAPAPAPRVFGPKSPEGSASLGALSSSSGNTTERAHEAMRRSSENTLLSGGTGSRSSRASAATSGREHGFRERSEHRSAGAFGKGARGRTERGERRGRNERDEHYTSHSTQEVGAESSAGAASRAAAARIVEAVNAGKSLNDVFVPYCKGLDPRDQAFVHEIVFGTLRQRRVLMQTLKPMFNYKLTEHHRIVQSLLITALYQLVFMRVPAHAVVSATVSACGECNRKSFAATVNAILRRFLREGGALNYEDEPAVKYSFPDWLATRLQEAYGEKSAQIMERSNEKAPLFLRVELSKISRDDYLKMLQEKEIAAHSSPLGEGIVRLESPTNVTLLPGFNQGLSTVQDISAQLAAPLLELQNGKAMRVLDCCCAPGGKSAHILDLNAQVKLTAIDVDAERLKQTASTLERLGRIGERAKAPAQVELKEMDAQDLSALEGQFDRIIVDAPCSGTGVIRRHPDIKWLRRARDIPALVETQAKILDEAYQKLSPGGILLYTTCSILPEENSEQITAFCQRHSEAKLLSFTLNGKEYETLQRLPGEDDGDGFFYARVQKPL